MPAKRKTAAQQPPADKRRKLAEEEKDTKDEKEDKEDKEQDSEEGGSGSESEYEPSGSDASDASDASSSSGDDMTTTSDDESQTDEEGSGSSSGSDSGSGSDGESEDKEESGDDKEPKGKGEKKSELVGREVSGGRTLRPLREDRPPSDPLLLPDLSHQHLPIASSEADGLCRAACIKGRVFIASDRIYFDGRPTEIAGFITDAKDGGLTKVRVRWLSSAEKGLRFGNYAREAVAVDVPLRSDTDLKHLPKSLSLIKITHEKKAGQDGLVSVAGDKGRSRPALFGVDKRWNAGELKRMLMFVRRVWPSCRRPPSVTIAMRPPPHKDHLSAPDDNEDDVKDIEAFTAKYKTLWQATVNRSDAHASSAQQWMANTFDSWRRQYITVAETDWENAHREFWAAAHSSLPPSLPP